MLTGTSRLLKNSHQAFVLESPFVQVRDLTIFEQPAFFDNVL